MKNVLSIDVEECWMGEFARKRNVRKEYHSDESVPQILDLLKEYEAKATFFCVGQSVSDESLRLIAGRGNEIAFHTEDHVPLWEKNPDKFRRELVRFQNRVLFATREFCTGFRAPSFSTVPWMYESLRLACYSYDSSIFPSANFLYGSWKAPTYPYDTDGIQEFPITTGDLRTPVGGGFYWRLLPPFIVHSQLDEARYWDQGLVLYVHNWELFPKQKLEGLSHFGNFYCNHNLEKTLPRLRKILERYQFTTFKEILGEPSQRTLVV